MLPRSGHPARSTRTSIGIHQITIVPSISTPNPNAAKSASALTRLPTTSARATTGRAGNACECARRARASSAIAYRTPARRVNSRSTTAVASKRATPSTSVSYVTGGHVTGCSCVDCARCLPNPPRGEIVHASTPPRRVSMPAILNGITVLFSILAGQAELWRVDGDTEAITRLSDNHTPPRARLR